MNFLATLLIVAKASPDTFAAYTVGLSVLMLAANWSDAGLANTLQVLATQYGNERERLEQYKKVGLRYAMRIVPIGFALLLGLAAILYFQSQVFRSQDSFYLLAAFAVIGVVAARTSFWNALLYSSGNFKRSSIVQAVPAVVRVILIVAAITITGLNFGLLMVLTLLPVVLGWGLSWYAWWRTIVAMPCASGQQSEAETSAEVWRFLKPTMASVIFNSLSYNITLLGASFFTTGVAIAGYGIFLRLNQVISIFLGVLTAYVARQLRLMPSLAVRKQRGIVFIIGALLIYLAYTLVAMATYRVLSLHIHHYSLDYLLEFAVFLFGSGIGYTTVILDAVLASFGRADHRLLGSAALVGLNAVLILLMRPNNLFLMVIIDTLSILPTLFYYVWVFRQMSQDNTVNSSMTMEHLN